MQEAERAAKSGAVVGGRRQSKIVAAGYDASLNMHNIGPGEPALAEWRAAGLRLPDLAAVREYRLRRVRDELRRRDLAGVVLFDPLNIRYAADSTNMQLWIAHNAARYCFVAADGPLIVFDYHGCDHLSAHNPLIDEVRPATSWFYFSAGERLAARAEKWAGAGLGHRQVKGVSVTVRATAALPVSRRTWQRYFLDARLP